MLPFHHVELSETIMEINMLRMLLANPTTFQRRAEPPRGSP